jgi:endonuclease YncB( thermonuclease family)
MDKQVTYVVRYHGKMIETRRLRSGFTHALVDRRTEHPSVACFAPSLEQARKAKANDAGIEIVPVEVK